MNCAVSVGKHSSTVRILIVGEARTGADELKRSLRPDGYVIEVHSRELEAISIAESWRPDIVIVDGDLCNVDIPRLCSKLYSSGTAAAILVRIQKNRALMIPALNAGADDCIGEKCSLAELRARIRSQIKRKLGRAPVKTNAWARTERTPCGMSDV